MILIHILKFLYLEIKIQLNDIVHYLSTDKNNISQNNIEFKTFLKNLKKNYYQDQKKLNSKNGILVDLLLDHIEYCLINLLIAKELQNQTKKKVTCMIYEKDIKNKLIAEQFGFTDFIILKKENFIKRLFQFTKSVFIFKNFRNEKDFNDYKISNFEVGKIALERFFRFNKNINNKNEIFFKILNMSKAISNFYFFSRICKNSIFNFLVIGEHQFIPHRIIFNLSLKKNIKVIRRWGGSIDGIKLRIYNKYSDRYSHPLKFSKKVKNYFIKNFENKNLSLNRIYSKMRNLNDIGIETVWEKKINKKFLKNRSFSFLEDKKTVLILPHIMNDGMFLAKWGLYNTPYDWFVETLKIIKNINSINWIIKPHPSEKYYNTNFKTLTVFKKLIKDPPGNIKIIDNNTNLKVYEKKISYVLTCHGSAGYEYPSIGIPCVTTADTRYKHFEISHSINSLNKYKKILNNFKETKKIKLVNKNNAKLFWLLTYGLNVDFDILPKRATLEKMSENYLIKLNKLFKQKKAYSGSFYKSFKYQIKYNNRHSINHKVLENLNLKKYNIKNDI